MKQFKPVQDTFIFKHLNRGDRMNKDIMEILTKGERVTEKNLEEALMVIKRNYKYPLKNDVLQALQTGQITLMFAPKGIKLPTCMPWFLTKNSMGNIVAVVCVDVYGSRNPDTGDVSIEPKKLYALMEGALLGIIAVENYQALRVRADIIQNGSSIFSNMLLRVLNKKYSLNIDRNRENRILFLTSKFFMLNVLGMEDSEKVYNYCIRNCKNPNELILGDLDDNFPESAFKDFASFVTELSTNSQTSSMMPGLTVRGLLEQIILMFDSTVLLGLESFPYFMYNVNLVVAGSYMNNQYILENIIDNMGAKLYLAMAKLR